MRIVLLTGKGGVGKTTVAAATGSVAAAAGQRTLVISTDAAHSLADVVGCLAGPDPTQVAPGLWVQQVDPQVRLEQSWAHVQQYLLTVLGAAGIDPVTAEELTVLPGAEEVLALLEVRRQVRSQEWDVVIVDCAPTAETLRLLALPEALGWYLDRVLAPERGLLRRVVPALSRVAGVPVPEGSLVQAARRLHADLVDVHALLSGPDAGVRLVLTPESMVLAEARRAWTSLSLFGYVVDGVVVNRVFPDTGGDAWRERWVGAQRELLGEVEHSFAGLRTWRVRYREREPVGLAELADLGRTLGEQHDLLGDGGRVAPLRVTRDTGGAVLRLRLPLVTGAEVDLGRNGGELVVTVGPYRRLLSLPAGLARLRVGGARVREGELQVRFEDEAQEGTT